MKLRSIFTGGLSLAIAIACQPLSAQTLNDLYNFSAASNQGYGPAAGLVQGTDGNFYGMTLDGGGSQVGTVFKVTSTSIYTPLATFTGPNGAYPDAKLVQGTDGNFYGSTSAGGSGNSGAVFTMTPAGALTALASFDGVNGSSPQTALIQGTDGNFYGTTQSGGANGQGTAFQLIMPPPSLTSLVGSTGQTGSQGLVQVELTGYNGAVLANASVTLSVTTGASTISATTTPGSLTSVTVLTNASGIASAYVTFNSFATDTLVATTQNGFQTNSISINLNPLLTNASIAGMLLWLKADTVGTSGPLSLWQDQSGNGNNVSQSNSGDQPTQVADVVNGYPVVRFSGSSQYLTGATTSAFKPTKITVMAVYRLAAAGNYPHVLSQPYAASGWSYPYESWNLMAGWGSNEEPSGSVTVNGTEYNNSSGAADAGSFVLDTLTYDGTSTKLYVNGSLKQSQSASGSIGYNGGTSFWVGGDANNEWFDGDVAEILVFSQALTAQQLQTVSADLAGKYQLPGFSVASAPTNLTATAVSSTQASLEWNEPPTTASIVYNVERQTGAGAFTQVAQVTNALSYVDTGLAPGTTYTYRVSAQGNSQNLGYSNMASVTTLPSGAPNMPFTGLKLWLKADEGSIQPGPIGSWLDQSGNNNNVSQTNPSNQPNLVTAAEDPTLPNGRPVIRFNGSSNQFLTGTTTSSFQPSNLSVVAVYRLNATGSWPVIILQPYASSGWSPPYVSWTLVAGKQNTSQPEMEVTTGGTQYDAISDASELGSFALAAATYNGNDNEIYINGVLQDVELQTGPISYNTSGTFYVGSDPNNEALTGDIAEILVYDHALSASDLQAIGTYLTGKYQIPGITVPSAPAGLAASAVSSTQVSVYWNEPAPSDSVAYNLQRQTGSGPFTTIAQITNTLSYLDTGLTPGTTYTYRVSAQSYAGSSGYSNTASATTQPAGATDLPLSSLLLWLKADTIGAAGSVSAWLDQSGNGNTVAQANASSQPTLVTSAVDPTVPNGRPVVRFNGSSQELAGVTTSAFQPTNITVVAVYRPNGNATNNAKVIAQPLSATTWSAPYLSWSLTEPAGTTQAMMEFNNGGTLHDSRGDTNLLGTFNVVALTYDGNDEQVYTNGILQSSQAVAGSITYGTSGNFYVGGDTPLASPSEFFNGDIAELLVFNQALTPQQLATVSTYLGNKYGLYTVPPVPANLTATALSSTQVSLQWSAPASPNLVNYLVERSTDGVNFTQVASVANSSSYIDTGLTPGATYIYRLQAQDYAGTSAASSTATATTQPSGATNLPFNGLLLWLKADAGVEADSNGNIGNWSDQSGNGNMVSQGTGSSQPKLVASVVNGYPVVRFGGGQALVGTTTAAFEPANLTVMAVFRTAAATDYPHIIGQPYSASGWSPPYESWTMLAGWGSNTQPATGISTSTTETDNFSDTTESGSFILVTSTYDGVNNGLYIDGILRSVTTPKGPIVYGGSSNFWVGDDPNNETFNGDIAEILVYNRELSPMELQTVGTYLNDKYQLPGFSTPSVPTGLAASAVSSTQVSLQWNETPPAGENVAYTIQRQTGSGPFATVAQVSNALSYVDTGLTAGTTYTYQVSAQSYAGSSGYSGPASAMTPANGATDMPLTSLSLWLKADTATGAGSVPLWPDQSGNNNNVVQPTAANQPTFVTSATDPTVPNGRPVVRFTGSSDQVLVGNTNSSIQPSNITVMAVYRQSANPSTNAKIVVQPYSATSWSAPYLTWSMTMLNGPMVEINSGGTLYSEPSDTSLLGAFNLATAGYNGANESIYVNGVPEGTQAVTGPITYGTSTNFYVGGDTPLASPSEYLTGDIAEIMVFNRALTAQEIQSVGSYLDSKYSFTPAPAVPVLTVSGVNSGQNTLSWLWDGVAFSYLIERSVDGSAFTQIAQANISGPLNGAMTFTDTNLPTGNVYSYRIQAVGYAGTSAYSNTADAVNQTAIDPTDGLPDWVDLLLGLNPLANNSGAFPQYPTGYGPPSPPPPNPPLVVILLTPNGATLN